jgi:hypothetical protein
MATLVLQIPDESLVSKVKQACKMIMGVASIKVQKDAKPKEYDVTKTAGSTPSPSSTTTRSASPCSSTH